MAILIALYSFRIFCFLMVRIVTIMYNFGRGFKLLCRVGWLGRPDVFFFSCDMVFDDGCDVFAVCNALQGVSGVSSEC